MKTIELKLDLSRSGASFPKYPLLVGSGLIENLDKYLKKLPQVHRYVIITDKTVEKLYGKDLQKKMLKKGLQVDLVTFPAGEAFKNEQVKMGLDHALFKKKCGRDTMILAFGGGVVGDMAGFVAATYMRGIPYVQIPTSFLGMVDSSIGGKVGIDTPFGKNLIGAFWHPAAVIADLDFLKKLPRVQLINGLVESLKIFSTYDLDSFEYFESNFKKLVKGDVKYLQPVVAKSIELKIGVVERDEHEANERMVVNFGHTIGHALEYLSDYKLLHGVAVGLGILVESKISQLLGILSEADFQRIENLLGDLGIQKEMFKGYKNREVLRLITMDKKNRAGKLKLVLLKKIGEVYKKDGKFGHEVDVEIVKKALGFFINN